MCVNANQPKYTYAHDRNERRIQREKKTTTKIQSEEKERERKEIRVGGDSITTTHGTK